MSVLLAIAAVVTVAGALVAITGRDARIALIGLVVTLSAAPFLADPLPGPAALAARVVAALLGGYLLFVVLRETTAVTRGSLVGLPAEALAAAAAFAIGYGTNGLGSAPLGPAAASATGFALAVIAVAPIVRGADVFRLGVALAVLVTGAELVRVGLAGTPPPLEQLVTAGLTIGLLGTAAVLCVNGVAATGGLTLRNEPRRSALFEAHPIVPTAATSLRPTWLRRPRREPRAVDSPAGARRSGRCAPTPSTNRPVATPRPAAAQAELWPPEAAGLADREPREPAGATPGRPDDAPAGEIDGGSRPRPARDAPTEPDQLAKKTEPMPAEPMPAEPMPAEPMPAEPMPAEPMPAEPSTAEPPAPEPLLAEPLPAEPSTDADRPPDGGPIG